MRTKQTYIIHTVLNNKYIDTKTFNNVSDMRAYVDKLNVPMLPFKPEKGVTYYENKCLTSVID
jgi:hypothetical protein